MEEFTLVGILVLSLVGKSLEYEGCWWTGCNLDSWAVVGCSPLGLIEKTKKQCSGGSKYECCNSGPSKPAEDEGGSSNDIDNNVGEITYEQFVEAVRSNYPTETPSRSKFDAFIKSASTKGQITSKTEAAMALAQFLHESDGLKAKREYACKDPPHCPQAYRFPGCDAPGQYYYGRGYIQLSWCYNYRDASKYIFGDDTLIKNPDLVATDEQLAWDTAFWFWKERVQTDPKIKQGYFGASTNRINGGLECKGGAFQHRAKARFQIYAKVRKAFGLVGPGIESGCYN